MFAKWNSIKLIVSDFDGVMTDNRVLLDETGKEAVYVSRADGQAVHLLHSMGIEVAIMSSETNSVVVQRASKLNVKCIHGVLDKAERLKDYCKENNISLQNIANMGDNVNDYEEMQLAGVKIVPQDEYEVVKEIADYITETKGGYGVIREVVDLLQTYKKKENR